MKIDTEEDRVRFVASFPKSLLARFIVACAFDLFVRWKPVAPDAAPPD